MNKGEHAKVLKGRCCQCRVFFEFQISIFYFSIFLKSSSWIFNLFIFFCYSYFTYFPGTSLYPQTLQATRGPPWLPGLRAKILSHVVYAPPPPPPPEKRLIFSLWTWYFISLCALLSALFRLTHLGSLLFLPLFIFLDFGSCFTLLIIFHIIIWWIL